MATEFYAGVINAAFQNLLSFEDSGTLICSSFMSFWTQAATLSDASASPYPAATASASTPQESDTSGSLETGETDQRDDNDEPSDVLDVSDSESAQPVTSACASTATDLFSTLTVNSGNENRKLIFSELLAETAPPPPQTSISPGAATSNTLVNTNEPSPFVFALPFIVIGLSALLGIMALCIVNRRSHGKLRRGSASLESGLSTINNESRARSTISNGHSGDIANATYMVEPSQTGRISSEPTVTSEYMEQEWILQEDIKSSFETMVGTSFSQPVTTRQFQALPALVIPTTQQIQSPPKYSAPTEAEYEAHLAEIDSSLAFLDSMQRRNNVMTTAFTVSPQSLVPSDLSMSDDACEYAQTSRLRNGDVQETEGHVPGAQSNEPMSKQAPLNFEGHLIIPESSKLMEPGEISATFIVLNGSSDSDVHSSTGVESDNAGLGLLSPVESFHTAAEVRSIGSGDYIKDEWRSVHYN
ncbi:hypothetical protein HDU81_005059 [Chytriomyces hyalinus]|nr:hypothetical protein HDU81_005059 [Chytriomyces hyalinus]